LTNDSVLVISPIAQETPNPPLLVSSCVDLSGKLNVSIKVPQDSFKSPNSNNISIDLIRAKCISGKFSEESITFLVEDPCQEVRESKVITYQSALSVLFELVNSDNIECTVVSGVESTSMTSIFTKIFAAVMIVILVAK